MFLQLQLPTWWALLLSASLSAATFALWLQVMAKVRTSDPVMAAGWGVFGGVAVASGLMASRLLVPVAAGADALTGAALVAALGAAVLGSCGALALARWAGPRGAWAWAWGSVQTLLLLVGLTVATGEIGPAARPPTWASPALVDRPIGAAMLLGVLLAVGARLSASPTLAAARADGAPPESGQAAPWTTETPQRQRRRIAGSAGVFAIGLALVDAGRLAALWAPGAVPSGPRALGLAEQAALAACVFALAAGWVTAVADRRTWRRTHELTTSLGEANTRLRDLAMRDALTRLPNRLYFEERLSNAIERVDHGAPGLAVMFLDLDGFKPINDSFGHVVGDDVLREVGRRLQGQARSTDTVARVGGDEFVMLIEGAGGEAQVSALAQRLLRLLGEPYALPNGLQFELACSVGVAMYPQHGPPNKLIANADAAMYAAKGAGGATIAFFEPRMELDALAQLQLQHELRQALDRNELTLYYQPKIDGTTGQLTGVEALVRWQHPVRGVVEPGQFIPVAERFGLIGALGNWVIEDTCRQLRAWLDEGLRMRVSVNLSMHQLRQDDLITRIRMSVERHRVDAALLTFEITESAAMEDTQATLRALAQISRIGSILSIDDFGTGYSSLAYLRKLPAQQLKIDRSFVADIGHSDDALAVVDAVIKLAHALGLRVVAEGVETERQRQILLTLRCDELQGYLFAKPMPAHMLSLWALGDDEPATVPAPWLWPTTRAALDEDDSAAH